jgi:hypothetical protein
MSSLELSARFFKEFAFDVVSRNAYVEFTIDGGFLLVVVVVLQLVFVLIADTSSMVELVRSSFVVVTVE